MELHYFNIERDSRSRPSEGSRGYFFSFFLQQIIRFLPDKIWIFFSLDSALSGSFGLWPPLICLPFHLIKLEVCGKKRRGGSVYWLMVCIVKSALTSIETEELFSQTMARGASSRISFFCHENFLQKKASLCS